MAQEQHWTESMALHLASLTDYNANLIEEHKLLKRKQDLDTFRSYSFRVAWQQLHSGQHESTSPLFELWGHGWRVDLVKYGANAPVFASLHHPNYHDDFVITWSLAVFKGDGSMCRLTFTSNFKRWSALTLRDVEPPVLLSQEMSKLLVDDFHWVFGLRASSRTAANK